MTWESPLAQRVDSPSKGVHTGHRERERGPKVCRQGWIRRQMSIGMRIVWFVVVLMEMKRVNEAGLLQGHILRAFLAVESLLAMGQAAWWDRSRPRYPKTSPLPIYMFGFGIYLPQLGYAARKTEIITIERSSVVSWFPLSGAQIDFYMKIQSLSRFYEAKPFLARVTTAALSCAPQDLQGLDIARHTSTESAEESPSVHRRHSSKHARSTNCP